jgi:hypothetical protein
VVVGMREFEIVVLGDGSVLRSLSARIHSVVFHRDEETYSRRRPRRNVSVHGMVPKDVIISRGGFLCGCRESHIGLR